jgi:hypothetical protein
MTDRSAPRIGVIDPFSWRPPAGLSAGFFGHPDCWPQQVLFAVAEGATGATSAACTPEALAGVVAAVRRLEGRCDLIVGGCGYFGAAWPLLTPAPATPTVLSALDLLDSALLSTSKNVAILSMSRSAATDFVADRADVDRIRVVGFDGVTDWPKFAHADWAIAPRWSLDGLEAGVRQVMAGATQPGGPLADVGAVLLECTVLPQFRSVLREYTAAPIIELRSFVDQLLT